MNSMHFQCEHKICHCNYSHGDDESIIFLLHSDSWFTLPFSPFKHEKRRKKPAFVHALWKWVFEVISITLSLSSSLNLNLLKYFSHVRQTCFCISFLFQLFYRMLRFQVFFCCFLEFFEGFAFCIQIQCTSVGEFMRHCEKERWYYNWRRKKFALNQEDILWCAHYISLPVHDTICGKHLHIDLIRCKEKKKKKTRRKKCSRKCQTRRKKKETNMSSRIEGNITVNVQSAIGVYASGFMRKINATECGSANIRHNQLHEAFVTSCFFFRSFVLHTIFYFVSFAICRV